MDISRLQQHKGGFILLIVVFIELIVYLILNSSLMMDPRNWITIIANHLLLLGAIFSHIHLSTRLQTYEKGTPFAKYLRSLILFLIPVSIFAIFNIINEHFLISGLGQLTEVMDNWYPEIIFNIMGIAAFRVSMPMSSIFNFVIMLFGILFFLYPIETYVHQEKRPWRTLSIILCLITIPLIFIPGLVDIEILASIVLLTIVLIVLINFVYLFWTYFRVAIKSPSGPVRTGGFMIAFALITVFMTWATSWIISFFTDTIWIKTLVTYSVAMLPLLFLNLGFYLLRPITS